MGSDGEGKDPINLRELETRTLSNRDCQSKMEGVTDTDICAFSRKGQGYES